MITPSQRQILEAVLEALPECEDEWEQRSFNAGEIKGRNRAIDDVRAIINEFLEPVEGLTGKNPHEGKVYGGIRPEEKKNG